MEWPIIAKSWKKINKCEPVKQKKNKNKKHVVNGKGPKTRVNDVLCLAGKRRVSFNLDVATTEILPQLHGVGSKNLRREICAILVW